MMRHPLLIHARLFAPDLMGERAGRRQLGREATMVSSTSMKELSDLKATVVSNLRVVAVVCLAVLLIGLTMWWSSQEFEDAVVALALGLFILAIAMVKVIFTYRWYRRVLSIYPSALRKECSVKFEVVQVYRGKSKLVSIKAIDGIKKYSRYSLYANWNSELQTYEGPATVVQEPATREPIAVCTRFGMAWIAGRIVDI